MNLEDEFYRQWKGEFRKKGYCRNVGKELKREKTESGPQEWLTTQPLDLGPLIGLVVETQAWHEGLG